jgi:hypothetical protein
MSLTITNQFRIEKDALGEVQVPADRLWPTITFRIPMAGRSPDMR